MLSQKAGIPQLAAQFFGGTSILIVVGVVLDTMRQIETHLIQRNYDGFLRKGRIRGRAFDRSSYSRGEAAQHVPLLEPPSIRYRPTGGAAQVVVRQAVAEVPLDAQMVNGPRKSPPVGPLAIAMHRPELAQAMSGLGLVLRFDSAG